MASSERRPALWKACGSCGGTGVEIDWRVFGANVRQARKARGLGVREVGRRAGCSQAYVSDLELGHRTGWDSVIGRKILSIVGVPIPGERADTGRQG